MYMYMYLCHTNQIGVTMNNQSNYGLLKGEPWVWGFHPDLRMIIFVFLQKGMGFLELAFKLIPTFLMLCFTLVKPRTLWVGLKRIQNLIINWGVKILGKHCVINNWSLIIKALLFAFHEILNDMNLSCLKTRLLQNAVLGWWMGLKSMMVFTRFPSIYHLYYMQCTRISSNHLCLHKIFQFVNAK